MYCKKCWQKIEGSYNFYRNCGTNVVYYNKKNEPMYCSHYNSIVLSTDKYCKNCGYEFKNTNDRYNYIFILSTTIRRINLGFRPYTIGLAGFYLIIFYIFMFFSLSIIFWFLWSRLNNPISKLWCGSLK